MSSALIYAADAALTTLPPHLNAVRGTALGVGIARWTGATRTVACAVSVRSTPLARLELAGLKVAGRT
jgi:hypothetical protein